MRGTLTSIKLLLILLVALLLAGCGNEASTPTPAANAPSLPIPTFTAPPETPTSAGTPTPTPIVVPATEPPLPTITPTTPPTAVPPPTFTLRPSATAPPPTTPAGGAFHEVTVEQARNLNGYRAVLPSYLPTGFRLNRLSAAETSQPRLITLLAEYTNAGGQIFYYTLQAVPGATPTVPPSPTLPPTLSARVSVSPTTVPTPTFTPRPTPPGTAFSQESVTVRGQTGLLSINGLEASLRWSEGAASFSINGPLSKEEILKLAESLR